MRRLCQILHIIYLSRSANNHFFLDGLSCLIMSASNVKYIGTRMLESNFQKDF